MKLKVLAMAFCCGALAACDGAGEDNAADVEGNAGVMADGMGMAEENAADTLGNQLNQLNASVESNAANAQGNASGNAENGY